jgi:hypothetical protein
LTINISTAAMLIKTAAEVSGVRTPVSPRLLALHEGREQLRRRAG